MNHRMLKCPCFTLTWFSFVYVNDRWRMCSNISFDCIITNTFITVFNFVYNQTLLCLFMGPWKKKECFVLILTRTNFLIFLLLNCWCIHSWLKVVNFRWVTLPKKNNRRRRSVFVWRPFALTTWRRRRRYILTKTGGA